MLSPWPESLWAFRGIWDRVSVAARVVAIDLPGFGHSDGRPELIAPDAMGTFLARLIEEWGLGAPHVVGPDVGTAAALFLAANAPDKVTSLTIAVGRALDPRLSIAPRPIAKGEVRARTNRHHHASQGPERRSHETPYRMRSSGPTPARRPQGTSDVRPGPGIRDSSEAGVSSRSPAATACASRRIARGSGFGRARRDVAKGRPIGSVPRTCAVRYDARPRRRVPARTSSSSALDTVMP